MSDKLLLCVILTVSCTLSGFAVGKYFKVRKEYFVELDDLLLRFSSNLTFTLDTVPKMLSSYETKSSLLSRQLAAAVSTMSGDKKELPSGYLSKSEFVFVDGMFGALGTYNSVAEKCANENNRLKLKEYREASESKYNKLGKSCVKLGFLLGLLLAVLFW